jgi:hypothetical protein
MIFVMVKCCVFFAVRTEFLNIIYKSFGFKGLKEVDHAILELCEYRRTDGTILIGAPEGIGRA